MRSSTARPDLLLEGVLTGRCTAPSTLCNGAVPPQPQRIVIDRVPIDGVTMDYAVAWTVRRLKDRAKRTPLLITGPNAQLVTIAAANARFAEALQTADLCVPDGISVVLGSRLLKGQLPERVTGGDLMERLCAESAKHGLSVFFLGGLPGAAVGAAVNLQRRYPGLRVAGTYCPPYGFENDAAESARIRRIVSDATPDLLCVAFGAPKQEIWMHDNCPSLPIGAAIAVGAALDTQAGLRKRAPRWTHKMGIEWLYRFAREPRRLWRRYLLGNSYFLFLVVRQWLVGACRFNVEPDRRGHQFTGSSESLRGEIQPRLKEET